LGASRTLFRPEPDELAVRGTLNLVQLELVTGNPGLDPFRSTNLDASLEYYFGSDGLLSLAVFYKDIESFISTRVPTGATFITDDGDEVTVVGPANGQGGKLQGFELGLQMSFTDILPAPFDGLGIVANYTFIDDKTRNVTNFSTGEAVGLAGVSRHSYNLIGFYEKGPFSGRLAYNWRSSFLQPDRGSGQLNMFTDDYGALDGRIALQVMKPLEIYFEAKNITNADIRGFAEDPGRIGEYFNFGRRFFVGAQYTF
jgi:TonB-dependent receptor